MAAVLIYSLGNSSDAFLILRAQEAGIAAKYAPLLGFVFNVTYTLSALPAGWLSDRLSNPLIAVLGYVVFAATYTGVAATPIHEVLWVMMAFYVLYYWRASPVLCSKVV